MVEFPHDAWLPWYFSAHYWWSPGATGSGRLAGGVPAPFFRNLLDLLFNV